jgi:DNA invertase Pin-like site-specific DNA recombinase
VLSQKGCQNPRTKGSKTVMETTHRGQTVGYVRVSTVEQNPARQYEALGGCDEFFEDRISGKSADRPKLAEMVKYVRKGDTVRVASMDRLARNLLDLRRLVEELTAKGARVEFVKEGQVFTGEDSPMANLLLSLLGAVAEFERSLIHERQAEGIAAAKARGEYAGRGGRPKVLTPEQIEEAKRRVEAGEHKAAVARAFGVGRSSLYRALCGEGVYAEAEPGRLAASA